MGPQRSRPPKFTLIELLGAVPAEARSSDSGRVGTKAKARACSVSFTLIELLVVVAIIAILAAMLLPALQRARASALLAKCASNMKQMGLSLEFYDGEYDGYLPREMRGSIINWTGLNQALVVQYPQFQMSSYAATWDFGYEGRLLLAGHVEPTAEILKCPSDPRQDWTPALGASTWVINPTRTPVITYTAAACWAGKDGNGNYCLGGTHPPEPFKRDKLTARAADNELYLVHGGGSTSSLLVVRPVYAPWGGGWGHPVEYHGTGSFPAFKVDPAAPYRMIRTDGVDMWSGGYNAYADLNGWRNPYLLMDGHVEVVDSIWHDRNIWHYYENQFTPRTAIPGDMSAATSPGYAGRTAAVSYHGF